MNRVRSGLRFVGVFWCLLGCAGGTCGEKRADGDAWVEVDLDRQEETERSRDEAVAPRPESDPCERERERLSGLPALAGSPELQKNRAEILGRARATPVLFLESPRATAELPTAFAGAHDKWAQAKDPATPIQEALRRTRSDKALRRAVFLRDGYLFADTPLVALRLSQMLRLDHLFDEPELRVHRGGELLKARRHGGRYWVEGAVGQEEMRLFLFDRIELPSSTESAPLHLDLRAVIANSGASRIEIERLTGEGILARLEYGQEEDRLQTRAILRAREDGLAELQCESKGGVDSAVLDRERARALDQRRLFQPVLSAIDRMVLWALPFDEPKTEEGQQDGKLRVEFQQAYLHGRSTYEFNGDKYYVFDPWGRPRLPQVCIDFVTDAFDWATGGDWAPSGKSRARRKGALHFPSFRLDNHRSVEKVEEFAILHPEWFDVVRFEKEERVPFGKRGEFFAQLERSWARYRLGDVIFINGLRSDERYHYHSFIVVELDPITGIPLLLAANAGRAQIRTWEGEMASAPRRYIVSRVRVRSALLERAYEQARERPGVPLDLAPAEPAVD